MSDSIYDNMIDKGMIVITKIDYIKVTDSVVSLTYTAPNDYEFMTEGKEFISNKFLQEQVLGRRFYRPQSKDIITIGLSLQASELLELQYQAWDEQAKIAENMKEELHKKSKTIAMLENALKGHRHREIELCDATFFTRLKWLLAGFGSHFFKGGGR